IGGAIGTLLVLVFFALIVWRLVIDFPGRGLDSQGMTYLTISGVFLVLVPLLSIGLYRGRESTNSLHARFWLYEGGIIWQEGQEGRCVPWRQIKAIYAEPTVTTVVSGSVFVPTQQYAHTNYRLILGDVEVVLKGRASVLTHLVAKHAMIKTSHALFRPT